MDEISGAHGPHQLPAVPVERPSGLVATAVHDAAERLRPHWPGVADWAQRHVFAAFASFIGCAGMILAIIALLVVRGVSSLSGEYEETLPGVPVEASVTPAAHPSLLASGEREYRVRRNDTLSDIAAKHGVALSALRERNALTLEAWRAQCLKNARIQPGACPDVVFKGEKLIIPAPQAISPE